MSISAWLLSWFALHPSDVNFPPDRRHDHYVFAHPIGNSRLDLYLAAIIERAYPVAFRNAALLRIRAG